MSFISGSSYFSIYFVFGTFQDRDTLIDLMLEFVEAMNPNILFTRKFVVLNNRDLTGELKDIWAVVQRKRAQEKMAHSMSQSDENYQPEK